MRSFSEGPKSNDWSLEEKREGDGRQAQGRKGLVKIGRGGQDAATSQEAPRPLANTRSWKTEGQSLPWNLQRGQASCQHLDIELGENAFLLFGAAQSVVILQQHQETHTQRKWEVTCDSKHYTNVQDTVLREPEQGRKTSCRRTTNI